MKYLDSLKINRIKLRPACKHKSDGGHKYFNESDYKKLKCLYYYFYFKNSDLNQVQVYNVFECKRIFNSRITGVSISNTMIWVRVDVEDINLNIGRVFYVTIDY